MKIRKLEDAVIRNLIIGLLVPLLCPLAATSLAQEFFTATEKSALEKERKVDNRIKVYEAVSTRLYRSMQGRVREHDFAALEGDLETWVKLLSASLEDIEENVSRKKKPRALIRFEIHLRRTILDAKSLKFKLPHERQDQFDFWLERAEEARKKIVAILFPG